MQKSDVRKGLREIAEKALTSGVVLFTKKAYVVAQRSQLLEVVFGVL